MKKKLIIITFFIAIGFTIIYFTTIFGWMTLIENKDTPAKFSSHVKAKKEVYSGDSVKVLKQLQNLLDTHRQSFYSNEYYRATQLSIDTLLYSPDFSKVVVFVIAKNPTSRQLAPDERYEWYYVGYCYLCVVKRDSIDLSYINPSVKSYFKNKVAKELRANYFRLFATVKDINGHYKYGYNLNDIRFWNCPIWKEIKEKEQNKKIFDKEKKEHPENIYEPKPPHYDD